jgi:daunorubicin resistance ABC transporter membrane protein
VRHLRGVYTIWYRDVLRFVRDRSRIVASMAQPLMFLFIFGTGLNPAMSAVTGGAIDFRQFMFPGVLCMAVLFTAIFSAISVVWDREFGFLKEVLVAPVSRTAVALGKVAGGATISTLQGLVVLLLAPIIGIRLEMGTVVQIIGLMLLLASVATAFGLVIAARQKTLEGFQMIMNFLLMPLFFFVGCVLSAARRAMVDDVAVADRSGHLWRRFDAWSHTPPQRTAGCTGDTHPLSCRYRCRSDGRARRAVHRTGRMVVRKAGLARLASDLASLSVSLWPRSAGRPS